MLPDVREPRKALDVMNGLDQLPQLSVGGDGQLRLCPPPPPAPGLVAYLTVNVGSYLQNHQ